jgi:hypothetical protein
MAWWVIQHVLTGILRQTTRQWHPSKSTTQQRTTRKLAKDLHTTSLDNQRNDTKRATTHHPATHHKHDLAGRFRLTATSHFLRIRSLDPLISLVHSACMRLARTNRLASILGTYLFSTRIMAVSMSTTCDARTGPPEAAVQLVKDYLQRVPTTVPDSMQLPLGMTTKALDDPQASLALIKTDNGAVIENTPVKLMDVVRKNTGSIGSVCFAVRRPGECDIQWMVAWLETTMVHICICDYLHVDLVASSSHLYLLQAASFVARMLKPCLSCQRWRVSEALSSGASSRRLVLTTRA